MLRLWPRSLKGQLLLTVALALLLAQAISATLIYRAQSERREALLIHAAAFRLFQATRGFGLNASSSHHGALRFRDRIAIEARNSSPLHTGEPRDLRAESELRHIFAEQQVETRGVVVTNRALRDDTFVVNYLASQQAKPPHRGKPETDRVVVAGIQLPDNRGWLVARVMVPEGEQLLVLSLIGQTLLIYGILVGAIAVILRRITDPLAALTGRVERFAATHDPGGQFAPEGPDDVRRLIRAHNAMEGRIAALIDEKDVMLGAIGHDLKTPLSAMRVRIESVEDDTERAKLAATIEDMSRSLDDILSLARAGHARERSEPTELSALTASVVEEYEDLGDNVTLGTSERIVLPLRNTWFRRALRNLIGNALRYGGAARVSLARDGSHATIRIDDDGPGIPEGEIARMLEPFTRGEPSRNSDTGGAGLGLALARAIAEQHSGSLTLSNRRGADGAVAGLRAELRLPFA